MTEHQRLNAEVAILASLNSTSLYHDRNFADPSLIRQRLLGEVRYWFHTERTQSSQFDKGTTLELVANESLTRLILLLDKMGKNPFSRIPLPCVFDEHGHAIPLWEQFIDLRTSKLERLSTSWRS